MRHGIQACFVIFAGLTLLLPAAVLAQIDPSLFGDHLGPPISQLPDSGDDYLVVDGERSLEPEAAMDGPFPAAPAPSKSRVPEESTNKPEPAAKPKESRGWFKLPWRSKRRENEERLARERELNRPKLGKLRAGSSAGTVGVDDGLLPSELGRWKRDPRKAMKQARAERKMLLLWMTDSLRSSTSKAEAVEVFRHTQFLRMAKDYMVLTKIDFAESEIASHSYTRYLKEKLNVLGYPVLILFSPESKEVWRYRGYRRGRFPEIISDLRYQVKTHALKERHRHENLVAKGFRDWTNDRNQPVFAKALEVSREDKTVLFVDVNGKRYRYPVIRLSGEDRDWLAENFLR